MSRHIHPINYGILPVYHYLVCLPDHACHFYVGPTHISVTSNKRANAQTCWVGHQPFAVPPADALRVVRWEISGTWQSRWLDATTNMLHLLKDTTASLVSCQRAWHLQIVLAWLRIGHNHLTHFHILWDEGLWGAFHCAAHYCWWEVSGVAAPPKTQSWSPHSSWGWSQSCGGAVVFMTVTGLIHHI